MTTDELLAKCDRVDELSEAATPGPWKVGRAFEEPDTCIFGARGLFWGRVVGTPAMESEPTAVFIAEARTLLSQLAQAARELVGQMQRVFAATGHVGMGRAVAEVCDKVIRAHDRIIELQDDRDRLAARVAELEAAARPLAAAWRGHARGDEEWARSTLSLMVPAQPLRDLARLLAAKETPNG